MAIFQENWQNLVYFLVTMPSNLLFLYEKCSKFDKTPKKSGLYRKFQPQLRHFHISPNFIKLSLFSEFLHVPSAHQACKFSQMW